jgi:hypothetical protein
VVVVVGDGDGEGEDSGVDGGNDLRCSSSGIGVRWGRQGEGEGEVELFNIQHPVFRYPHHPLPFSQHPPDSL